MNNFVAKLMSFSLEINIYYCHEFKVCSKTIICSNKKKLVTRLPNFPDRRIRYEFYLKKNRHKQKKIF